MIMNIFYIFKSFVWGMLLLMSVSACSGYEDGLMGEGGRGYPVLLSVEEETIQGTKMSLEGTSVAWEESDKLRLTAVPQDGGVGVSELSVYSIDSENAKKAVFSGVVNMISTPEDCYFTYPYSVMEFDSENGKIKAVYTEQAGKHAPFLYGHSSYNESGMSAALKHIGAMLEIELLGMEGVSKILFAGNRLEPLSPLNINPSDGAFDLPTEANTHITVDAQENAKTYICVPPINFEKGFSLVLSKADGSAMAKSFSSDGSLNGGYDFRNKAGHIIPIKLDGSFVPFSIECSEPSWEHTKVNGLLTGTAVSFTMTKTGAPDKLIEEWGATLVNSEGVTVRKIKLTNAGLKNGESVTMDVYNNWKLLPEGTYTFTPYYKMYGKEITMDTVVKIVEIDDPGVFVEIGGMTSYDKFISSSYTANQANSHPYNKIEGVYVKTNLDKSIIDSYEASISLSDGNSASDKNKENFENGIAEYNDFYSNTFGDNKVTVKFEYGKLSIAVDRTFYITGLPMVADFTTGDVAGWTLSSVSMNTDRLVFNGDGQSTVRSPKIYLPDNEIIKVVTACDSRHNITKSWTKVPVDMYINVCSSSSTSYPSDGKTLTFSTDYYQSTGSVSDLKSTGKYATCNSVFELSTSTPSLIYGMNITNSAITGNLFVSFKHKIEYSK